MESLCFRAIPPFLNALLVLFFDLFFTILGDIGYPLVFAAGMIRECRHGFVHDFLDSFFGQDAVVILSRAVHFTLFMFCLLHLFQLLGAEAAGDFVAVEQIAFDGFSG